MHLKKYVTNLVHSSFTYTYLTVFLEGIFINLIDKNCRFSFKAIVLKAILT